MTAKRIGTSAKVTLRASTNDLVDSAPYGADYTVSVARSGSYKYGGVRPGRMASGQVTA